MYELLTQITIELLMSHQPLFNNMEQQGKVADYLGVPGLIYYRAFMSEKEQATVINEIDGRVWLTDLKRRVQHYGYKYDYKARRIDASMYVGPLPQFATEIANRLFNLGLMSKIADQLIINEYQPAQGISPHIDCEPCFQDGIATISLGSVYIMDLTDTLTKTTHHIPLELGSCLVFSSDARYRWKHGIKPRTSDNGIRRGRRISMTFRKVIA